MSLQMKVFISYADTDQKLAGQIAAGLEQAGLEVFADNLFFPGDNWAEETGRALRESEAMVVLLTPEALQSSNVRRNIEYALGNVNYEHRLIPVTVGSPDKLPEDSIPWILRRLGIMSLPDRGKPDTGIKRIAQALLDAA